MHRLIGRRHFLKGAGAVVVLGAANACQRVPGSSRTDGLPVLQLPPLRVSVDRITRMTVCTRPFRAQGPRMDVEKLGTKTVVHNYGHGGSGWSLSWGAGAIATASAMATGERDIAVIGCGALGLTTARQLQRAWARVTIYSKDLPPNVRSPWATGLYNARLAHRPRGTRHAGVQEDVGADVAPVAQDVSVVPGSGRHTSGIHRQLFGVR